MRGGQIGQYVPLVDVGLRELLVHVPGCLLIGEAVTLAVGHLVYAANQGRQKHGVGQVMQRRLGGEVGKETWPENTVVHGDEAARGEAAGGRRRPCHHHLVLAVRQAATGQWHPGPGTQRRHRPL